jgi:sulfite exporter TauE/SafE
MLYWTAFTIGLLGSTHCIGMCGPIAISLPYRSWSFFRKTIDILLYNLGRVFTYSLMGFIMGLLGRGLYLSGMQKNVSVVLGIVMLVVAIFSINLESKMVKLGPIKRINDWVKRALADLMKNPHSGSLFFVGILNGFLPCGLVYMALAGAISHATVSHSVLYMAVFGLGTIPMMAGIAALGHLMSMKLKKVLRKLVPVFIILFGLMFIMRGLNFDLPLDVQLWDDIRCH